VPKQDCIIVDYSTKLLVRNTVYIMSNEEVTWNVSY